MESLFILIPLALILVGLAVAIFFWAVKSGQFDDLDSEAKRILFERDEKPVKPADTSKESEHKNT